MQNKSENSNDERQEIFDFYEVPDPLRIKKTIRFIRKYFGEIRGLSVLDCGISQGGVADKLSKEGAFCFGIDVNPRKIEGVKMIQADLNRGIPDFGTKFDVIFAGEVVEHLFDDVKFIRECHKFLKPDGILIVTVPNLVSLFNRFLMLFGSMPLVANVAEPFHYHVYNRKRLKNLFDEEKFEIIKATSSYLFWRLSNYFSDRAPWADNALGFLGDLFPALGNQLMIFARKKIK